ncbi:MAG: 4'-phosphopantetheinyl transferase family protein, partial [Chloroflexota bacterium]
MPNHPPAWSAPPAAPLLSPGQVHLWLLPVDPPQPGSLQALDDPAWLGLLDPGERSRAGRFRFARDRARFIARRALLRRILALYTGVPPTALAYAVNPFGKPHLPDHPALCFNTSHSAGLALVALARQVELGVDIEHARPDFDPLPLAERFFSPAERAALAALPSSRRQQAFYLCWSRKEAYIKAAGR